MARQQRMFYHSALEAGMITKLQFSKKKAELPLVVLRSLAAH
jgi:hypothetical protein